MILVHFGQYEEVVLEMSAMFKVITSTPKCRPTSLSPGVKLSKFDKTVSANCVCVTVSIG